MAGSGSHVVGEDAGRGGPAERLAGTVVEAVLDFSESLFAVDRERSLLLGKYWRRSPLVFSLVPRC